MEKLRIVLDTKERYLSGQLPLDEARAILRERVKSLRPYEIALAEQELKSLDEDECRKEDIQQMMELFQDVLDTSRPDLPADHPIMCYLRENDEMRRLLKQVEELAQYPIIKNQWLGLYDELYKFRLHLSRKQNQLYSLLERDLTDLRPRCGCSMTSFVTRYVMHASSSMKIKMMSLSQCNPPSLQMYLT